MVPTLDLTSWLNLLEACNIVGIVGLFLKRLSILEWPLVGLFNSLMHSECRLTKSS